MKTGKRFGLLAFLFLLFLTNGNAADLVIDGGTQTLSGTQEYDTVEVINGGTLKVEKHTSGGGKLHLKADRILVDSSSTITATKSGRDGGAGGFDTPCSHPEKGYGGDGGGAGGDGGDGGGDTIACSGGGSEDWGGAGGGGGAGYGGSGGSGGEGGDSESLGSGSGGSGGDGGAAYGSRTSRSIRMGSGAGGGGQGGHDGWCRSGEHPGEEGKDGKPGGGALILNATFMSINGTVKANGGSGGDGGDAAHSFCWEPGGGGGGGGASGGGILIWGKDVNLRASIAASGGSGGTGGWNDNWGRGSSGGNGGGGRIKIFYCGLDDSSASYDVSGHESGTLYKKARNQECFPNEPENPEPDDGKIIRPSPSVTLSALYTDPNDNAGTLTFHNASDDVKIGSCNADDGDRCSVTWNDVDHGENDWYAIASKNPYGGNQSDTWNLVENSPPVVDDLVRPDDRTVQDNNTLLKVEFTDPDPGENLEIEFYNNDSGALINTNTSTGSGTVEGIWNSVDLTEGEFHWWHVNVSDPWEWNQSDDNASFYVNHPPNVVDVYPEDEGISTDSPTELRIAATDDESSTVTVYFYNDSDDVVIGKESMVSGGEAEVQWPGREIGNQYEWYADVSDGFENITAGVFSFDKLVSPRFRPDIRVETSYSSIITSLESPAHFVFKVENNVEREKSLNTSLHGVKAFYLDTDRSWKDYSLAGNSKKRFQIRVEPESTGQKELRIVTENEDLGVNTTQEIPVHVRDNVTVSQPRDVPGVGTVQLAAIVVTASVLYSFLL